MTSDNGKAGEWDWYDVCNQMDYMETHYNGTVQLNLSQKAASAGTGMLLCASFVGNEPGFARAAGGLAEVPFSPRTLRGLSKVASELLFLLQETIDDQAAGEIRLVHLE